MKAIPSISFFYIIYLTIVPLSLIGKPKSFFKKYICTLRKISGPKTPFHIAATNP